jgi:hypothetical protein
MKVRLLVGALALGLALAACGNQGNGPTAIAAPAKSSSDLPAYSLIEPRRVREAGVYVHRWSGMTFPTVAGQLKRVAIVQFDSAALDVSAEYQVTAAKGRALVSVYIYPMSLMSPSTAQAAEESCREEFEGVKQVLVQRFPTAELVDEWPENVPRLSGVAMGYAAAYDFTGDLLGPTEAVRSEAYLFCGIGGLWNVKYRASYSRGLAGTSMVKDVIAAVPTGVPQ